MHFAFVHARSPGAADTVLTDVASRLAISGHALAGVVPSPGSSTECHRCDRDLIDLASGQRFAISQRLGPGAMGCRMDGGALETAVAEVAAGFEESAAEILIVNKFGKLEATGRGFTPLIVSALERGLPVIVGVNDLNRGALDAFSEGLAVELPADTATVMAWARTRLCRAAA